MIDRTWYSSYLDRYRHALFDNDVFEKCLELKKLTSQVKDRGGKLMIAGNGASATIASHAAGDFTKQAKIPATTFHDSGLLTMMSNDFGYEHCISECIKSYHHTSDIVILISSSGRSSNMMHAAETSKNLGLTLVTFTGFEETNPLKQCGELNFWIPSRAYNVIENIHSIWLTATIDMHIGTAEYSV